MKAGAYWVGDLCYLIPQEDWSVVCQTLGDGREPVGGSFTLGGHEGAIFPTAYGDGVFFDQLGREFGVDSGTLGVFPAGVYESPFSDGGVVVDFPEDFSVSCVDGEMRFGHLRIKTKGGARPDFFIQITRPDGQSRIFSMEVVPDAYFHDHQEIPGLRVSNWDEVHEFIGDEFACETIEASYCEGFSSGVVEDFQTPVAEWQLLDKNHEPVAHEVIESAIFDFYLMRR